METKISRNKYPVPGYPGLLVVGGSGSMTYDHTEALVSGQIQTLPPYALIRSICLCMHRGFLPGGSRDRGQEEAAETTLSSILLLLLVLPVDLGYESGAG